MPKFVTPIALQLIQQKTGTEPFMVVAINWGAGISYYSSRTVNQMNGNLMDVGTIRNEKRSDSMCNVGSVHVKFSDTDGAIKFTLDNTTGENAPAAVYLAFNNTTQADWIPLIVGKTVGPISWDETTRIAELSIETETSSREIGYAAAYDDFTDLNTDAAGVPWPMIFGKCAHVPSLLVRTHGSCHLQAGLRLFNEKPLKLVNNNQDIVMVGNPDVYSYIGAVKQKGVICVDDASKFIKNQIISIIIEDVVFVGMFTDNFTFKVSESNVPRYKNLAVGAGPAGDGDIGNQQVIWLATPTPIANHHCYFNQIGGKEWYNYCVRQEGAKCWFRFPFKDPNEPFLPTKPTTVTEVYAITKCGIRDDVAGDHLFMKDAAAFRKKNVGANNFGSLFKRFDKIIADGASWWQVPTDVQIKTWNIPDPDIYVVSLSPLSSIKAVWGKRRVSFGGKTRFVMDQIPANYYTISTANYKINGLVATALLFFKPLSDYAGQEWSDEVYTTATGTIGPDPTAIIQWMLTNYTDLSCDTGMFKTASDKTDHKANFALFDKRDALKLAQEIAFQARCSLLLDNGGIGIIYIPSQPEQQATFSESNVKNIQLHYTERKDIVTKLIGTYSLTYKDKPHLAPSHQMNIRTFERVLRSLTQTNTRSRSETAYYIYVANVDAYGLHTRDEPAYIFNDYTPVKLMCDFWGFRFSNCWRLVKFETWLEGIRLQPFDGVGINFTEYAILNTNLVPGVVESVEFDPNTFVTTLMIWLPIVVGRFTMESKAWPG